MITGLSPRSPLAVYERGLATGSAHLVDQQGIAHVLPVPVWIGQVQSGDRALMARCSGPTLDIGCGPGRITAALAGLGVAALGVDISAHAVALTRSRGGSALRRDIFALSSGRSRWSHIVLADGNIGIGGDPIRLLWHCRELLDDRGSLVLDLEPPGQGLTAAQVQLVSSGQLSDQFAWAWLGVDAVDVVAAAAGLAVHETWRSDDGRWQAELVPARTWAAPTQDAPTQDAPAQGDGQR